MRKPFQTCALALLLAMSARAGIIQNGEQGPPPPPPPATMPADTANADGFMHTGFTSTDSVTEATLTLIQIVLNLS